MRRCLGSPVLLLTLVCVYGCSTAAPVVDVPRALPTRTTEYLPAPAVDGLPADQAQRVRQAHRQLLAGDLDGASDSLSALPSGLPQSATLKAQLAFAQGDLDAVLETLEGVALAIEGSEAAKLVYARSAELQRDLVLAYRIYTDVNRDRGSALAARRAAALESDVLDLTSAEFEEALERGRLDVAEEVFARLVEWFADSPQALSADLDLARADEDTLRELQALRTLRARTELEGSELARLARLELDLGDPQSGVDLFTELVEREPGNPLFRDGLAAAKFRFRLDMLPNEVSSLVRDRELNRGEFASLLYWVVPGVRSDRTAAGEIVSDVLDHPYREAIVRVVNLGLMRVEDAARHRFSPDANLPQGQALESLLRLPERLGANPACLVTFKNNPRPSADAVCTAAAACGLLQEGEPCLAGSSLSGAQASESLRRALALLE